MKALSSYRFNIVVRVILLISLSFALAAVFFYTSWFFTPLVLSILIVICTINLIYYQERTNREITNFLISLKQGSFSNRFTPAHKGKSFDELSELFQDINDSFQKVSMERESHYRYLQTLNENIGVAILSYLDDGKFQLVNPAAKQLFGKPILSSLNDVEKITPKVHQVILEIKQGGQQSIQTKLNGTQHELSITSRRFVFEEEAFNVVLIQDVKQQMDRKESESWQKLIRVLTHEIMNSVTPIVSLSKAVNTSIATSELSEITEEDKSDLITSIQTIENRSNGMLKFVNAYKDFARDIELQKSKVDSDELLTGVMSLMEPIAKDKGIELTSSIGKSANLNIDRELIEQVLINLIKNAIEELGNHTDGKVVVSAHFHDGEFTIRVTDNGSGIPEDVLENIFVPFFTTKRQGSGVGLSISRKVMQLHDGSLEVESSKNGSSFILVLSM